MTAYFEVYNKANVELVDLQATPMVRLTPTASRPPTRIGNST